MESVVGWTSSTGHPTTVIVFVDELRSVAQHLSRVQWCQREKTVLVVCSNSFVVIISQTDVAVSPLTLITSGGWPIWTGVNWNVPCRINMKSTCITMVAIEREQFGDIGKIIRPKVSTQQFTWHKTKSKITLLILCAFYIYCTVQLHLLITKSENILATFSSMIRLFLENVG